MSRQSEEICNQFRHCIAVAFALLASLASTNVQAQIQQRDFDLLAIETSCVEPSQKIVEKEIKAKGAWKSGQIIGPFSTVDLCAELVHSVIITSSGMIRVDARLAVPGQHVTDSKGIKRREDLVDLVPKVMPGGDVMWERK